MKPPAHSFPCFFNLQRGVQLIWVGSKVLRVWGLLIKSRPPGSGEITFHSDN